MLSKLFEHVLLTHYGPNIKAQHNALHCGFTVGANPTHTAVMLAEVLCEFNSCVSLVDIILDALKPLTW